MSTLLKAKAWPCFLLITAFPSLLSLLYKSPSKIHICTLPITHLIHHFTFPTPILLKLQFFSIVNKSFILSPYSTTFPTPKYGHLRLRSSVEGARDIMIHSVYRTGNISPTSCEN